LGSPIAETWVHVTTRIENEWQESGTGFLAARLIDETQGKVFLITNKHVVNKEPQKRENARFLTLFVNIRENGGTISAKSFQIPLVVDGQRLWREHPNPHVDVLAVDVTLVIESVPQLERKWVDYSLFATPELLQEQEITIGEEVLIIGYPLGLAHARTNFPLVRQGIVATRIGEPIHIDVKVPSGKTERVEIPGFLVDSAVVPGSSGSPVVLKPVIGRMVGGGIRIGVAMPYLLGIVSGTRLARIETEEHVFSALAGLGLVYDAATVRDTIEMFFR